MGSGAAAGGAEALDEGQSVGVKVGLQGGVVHHAADRVVGAQVAVCLLVDAVGVLGAQHDAGAALMGLQLVQRALQFPALAVERGELCGRGAGGIKDRGREPVAVVGLRDAGIIDAVLDDANLDAVALGALVGLAGVDARQERAVGQRLLARQQQAAGHAPAQVRAGLLGRREALEAVDAAISQAQHPRLQRPDQLVCQRVLRGRVRPQRDIGDRVRAALSQAHEPQLRKRAATLSARGPRPRFEKIRHRCETTSRPQSCNSDPARLEHPDRSIPTSRRALR